MAGSKFQYDESGGTFFYFLLSFLALVVIPSTYYFWPKDQEDSEGKSKEDKEVDSRTGRRKKCQCDQCIYKTNLLNTKTPWKKTKNRIIKGILLLGWLFLAWTAWKVTHLQHDYVNWDPFEILGIDPAASTKDIKKAYHKLSLIYHPDKETGDEKKFLMITKAYTALTDEDARKNWELYGNPDGPGATSFGIALPSWIIEKENSIIVLGIYALVFMIALPTIVGIWWYNSVKYGGDEVLLDTTQLYYYLIHKTPHMVLKRAIMIIAASTEFDRSHNSEIIERPSDNYEVPQLIREIPNLNEKNRERPLCFGYSIKARAFLYAHLSRMSLPPTTLEIDKNYIVKKCPVLIQEFVQCVSQLTMLALAGKISRSPSLDTLEAAMKLSPLIVQALWDSKNPLLQLPHITDDIIRHMANKKKNIRSLVQLASTKDEERRSMLRGLSDDQYEDLLIVLGNMPLLDVDVKTEVLDDEDSGNITAGAIVTVTVTLTRKSLGTLFGQLGVSSNCKSIAPNSVHHDHETPDGHLMNGDASGKTQEKENQVITNRAPVWDKKGKIAKKLKKQREQQKKLLLREQQLKQQQIQEEKGPDGPDKGQESEDFPESASQPSASEDEQKPPTSKSPTSKSKIVVKNKKTTNRKKKPKQESESESSSSDRRKGDDSDYSGEEETDDGDGTLEGSDDEDWGNIPSRKSKSALDTKKSRVSHTVHCPFFPDDKQEFWWIYLASKGSHGGKGGGGNALTSIPVLMTNLVDQESIDLKLTAPRKPGVYQYSVVVRSDSYVDFDVIKSFKLDVKEAKIIEQHPQWEMSEVEEEEGEEEESAVEDSDLLDEDDEEEGSGSENRD